MDARLKPEGEVENMHVPKKNIFCPNLLSASLCNSSNSRGAA